MRMLLLILMQAVMLSAVPLWAASDEWQRLTVEVDGRAVDVPLRTLDAQASIPDRRAVRVQADLGDLAARAPDLLDGVLADEQCGQFLRLDDSRVRAVDGRLGLSAKVAYAQRVCEPVATEMAQQGAALVALWPVQVDDGLALKAETRELSLEPGGALTNMLGDGAAPLLRTLLDAQLDRELSRKEYRTAWPSKLARLNPRLVSSRVSGQGGTLLAEAVVEIDATGGTDTDVGAMLIRMLLGAGQSAANP